MTKVIFICSADHSGSTLLDLLLGSNADCASLGEITHFPKNLSLNTDCTCGVPVRDCPVWIRVVSLLESKFNYGDLLESPYQFDIGFILASSVIDASHQTPLYLAQRKLIYAMCYGYLRKNFGLLRPAYERVCTAGRNKLAFLQVVASVLNSNHVIDSSKHYLEAIALYRAAPEKVKIILLCRDGRAVFHSGLKRNMSRKQALASWSKTYRRALPILNRHIDDNDLIRVKYEDLTDTPAAELTRICEAIGISYQPQMLEFDPKQQHITNGNRMRFSAGKGIRQDNEWKTRLSKTDLQYFETRASDVNRILGYS